MMMEDGCGVMAAEFLAGNITFRNTIAMASLSSLFTTQLLSQDGQKNK
jgi:hypothetical protein